MKVFILNGNNKKQSLCTSICNAYKEGVEKAGHTAELMFIQDIVFDPILHEGYQVTQSLEPDLVKFQDLVLWADHFVIVYPTWWGGLPAMLKGLFDRSFYSGFAYRYHRTGPWWDKLLKGRTAHIITTMDAPLIWYRFAYRSAGTHMLKNAILKFCGFRPVSTSYITRVRFKTQQQLAKDLAVIQQKATLLKPGRHLREKTMSTQHND